MAKAVFMHRTSSLTSVCYQHKNRCWAVRLQFVGFAGCFLLAVQLHLDKFIKSHFTHSHTSASMLQNFFSGSSKQ